MALTRFEQIWLRDVLGKTGFYRYLSKQEINKLHEKMNVVTYEKGERIIKEGTSGGAFYILAQGKVSVVKEDCNKENVPIAEIDSMNFFGEISLISSSPRITSVIAAEDVKVFVIGKQDFADIFMNNPNIQKILRSHSKVRSYDTMKKIQKRISEKASGRNDVKISP